MSTIESKDALQQGTAFRKEQTDRRKIEISANANVKYDLIGKLVEETGLTRKAVVAILQGIQPAVFSQFKDNPEEFIVKAAAIINDEKATAIIEHITYHVLDERYDADAIFADSSARGRLDVNAMQANKHLYNYVLYDSANERQFASELDVSNDVAVYVKLPGGFYCQRPGILSSRSERILSMGDKVKCQGGRQRETDTTGRKCQFQKKRAEAPGKNPRGAQVASQRSPILRRGQKPVN